MFGRKSQKLLNRSSGGGVFIIFIELGLGGVPQKIEDIVNSLGRKHPDLPVDILLRRKAAYPVDFIITNKNVKVWVYPEFIPIKIPFLFPTFVLYHTWRLQPRSILSFLELAAWAAVYAKLILFWRKIKVVVSHDNYASTVISGNRFSPVRHKLIELLYPLANVIFTCSQATKLDLVRNFGLAQNKVFVVPNWTRFTDRNIAKRKKKYDLIYAGRLDKLKNVAFLLRGMKKIIKARPQTSLLLVGDGDQRKELEDYVQDNGLNRNVSFYGLTSDVSLLLSQSRVFVFSPDPYSEGFPLAILEAMVAQIPVLTSRFAGVSDFLKDQVNGFIFDSLDDFVQKSIWLLDHQEDCYDVVQKAYELVRQKHSPTNIDIYLRALGR